MTSIKPQPEIGTKVRALTTTPQEQSVVVEVTAIERTAAEGTYVWGYRQYKHRRNGVRQTMNPQLYLVPSQEA